MSNDSTTDLVMYGSSWFTTKELLNNLYVEHSKALYRYAYRMVGNQYDAEDIVAETFMRVGRGYHGCQCKDSELGVKTWLFRITRNLSIDLLRRPKGQELGEYLVTNSVETSSIERLTVQEAIVRLPKEYQEPLILCDMEDQSAREAAEILKISVPALKSRLYRGRRALRDALSGTYQTNATAPDEQAPGIQRRSTSHRSLSRTSERPEVISLIKPHYVTGAQRPVPPSDGWIKTIDKKEQKPPAIETTVVVISTAVSSDTHFPAGTGTETNVKDPKYLSNPWFSERGNGFQSCSQMAQFVSGRSATYTQATIYQYISAGLRSGAMHLGVFKEAIDAIRARHAEHPDVAEELVQSFYALVTAKICEDKRAEYLALVGDAASKSAPSPDEASATKAGNHLQRFAPGAEGPELNGFAGLLGRAFGAELQGLAEKTARVREVVGFPLSDELVDRLVLEGIHHLSGEKLAKP